VLITKQREPNACEQLSRFFDSGGQWVGNFGVFLSVGGDFCGDKGRSWRVNC
jgi:hypothetical protein